MKYNLYLYVVKRLKNRKFVKLKSLKMKNFSRELNHIYTAIVDSEIWMEVKTITSQNKLVSPRVDKLIEAGYKVANLNMGSGGGLGQVEYNRYKEVWMQVSAGYGPDNRALAVKIGDIKNDQFIPLSL